MNKKLSLLREQKNRCFYCGEKIDFYIGEIDHVNPQNKTWARPEQYKEVKKDCVMSCSWCNSSKWAYPPLVWRYRLQAYIDQTKIEIKKRKRIIKSLDFLLS